jgi:hypothetical protein
MAVITIPAKPLPQSATPRPIDVGAWQEPVAYGTTTRLDRPGNHFALDVAMPRLKPQQDGRIWLARLVQAVGGIARMGFPQPGFDPGAPGAATVDGANVAGTILPIAGLPAGYKVREGQFLNVLDAAGNRYLHMATADAQASGAGKITIAITPMLRVPVANGSAVILDAPTIEGRVVGVDKGLTWERAAARGVQFSIVENR